MNSPPRKRTPLSSLARLRRNRRFSPKKPEILDNCSVSDDLDADDDLKLPENFAQRVLELEMELCKSKIRFDVVNEYFIRQ